MSYDRVIGVAKNVRELDKEMKRLAREDRPCLEYHLANGHIVSWLEYANEPEFAKDLAGVINVEEAFTPDRKVCSKIGHSAQDETRKDALVLVCDIL